MKHLVVMLIVGALALVAVQPGRDAQSGPRCCTPTPTPTPTPGRPTLTPEWTPTLTSTLTPTSTSPPQTPTRTLVPTSAPTPTPTSAPTLMPTVTPTPSPTSAPIWHYWVRIEEATTEYVVLECGAQPNHRGYSVYLNVCEVAEGCEWWPPYATRVFTETWWTGPTTIRWEDIDKVAKPGHIARIWWDCALRTSDGGLVILWAIRDKAITGKFYLPMILRR